MPSAFRRAGAKGSSSKPGSKGAPASLIGARGVKPWTGGIHLTSVGLNDLDSILGGGQPLGTCILLQEDRWTRDLALSLVKYWVAEGVSQEQAIIIPVSKERSITEGNFMDEPQHSFLANKEEVEELLQVLPRNLHWDKQRQKKEKQENLDVPKSLDILEEEGEEEEEKAEAGLEIAWQYKKSVQRERLGLGSDSPTYSQTSTNVFCHSYDLSGRMSEQSEIKSDTYIIPLVEDAGRTSSQQGLAIFKEIVALIKGKTGQAIRLLFYHPDLEAICVTLPLLLAHVRSHSLPVVVMVCVPPQSQLKSWCELTRISDVVLSTEGFASRKEYPPPPEFRHLQGLLKIAKITTITAAAANGGGHFGDLTISKRPAAFIYGFKRDRRKLHIPLLHIPPEDYAEGGGSVGTGVRSGGGKPSAAKKAGGGMGCSSNLEGSKLDF